MKQILSCIIVAVTAAEGTAQTLSVEDIRAQIEAERNQPDPYEEVLADPDPTIAKRAMEIMIESGDEELRDIAIDFGVNSPDPEFRHLALLAWFQSNPRMEIVFENDGSTNNSFVSLARGYRAVPNSEGKFILIRQITGYNEADTCFVSGRDCFFRHTPNGAWIRQAGLWQEIEINNQGQLTGSIEMTAPGSRRANVRFYVPVP